MAESGAIGCLCRTSYQPELLQALRPLNTRSCKPVSKFYSTMLRRRHILGESYPGLGPLGVPHRCVKVKVAQTVVNGHDVHEDARGPSPKSLRFCVWTGGASSGSAGDARLPLAAKDGDERRHANTFAHRPSYSPAPSELLRQPQWMEQAARKTTDVVGL